MNGSDDLLLCRANGKWRSDHKHFSLNRKAKLIFTQTGMHNRFYNVPNLKIDTSFGTDNKHSITNGQHSRRPDQI